jgi:outer membrane protein, heavy metal efflux system
MSFRRVRPWAALLLCAVPAAGQERSLTLEEALALAGDRGASIALAQGRIEEARARETQAERRFQENPVLEANGGYRRAEEGFFDFEAAVTQGLSSGGRRAARLVGARAALERAEAGLADAQRTLLRETGMAFVRALAARDRSVLLAHSRQAADELLSTVERSYEAGEATALELNRARTAAASARAEQSAAEAEGAAALAVLKGLLGLDSDEAVEVRGDLDPTPAPDLLTLLAGLDNRPDLRVLVAELREAEAEILLGEALARPDLGVRGGVAREEGAEIVTAGVVISLPIHNRGEETLAVGQARAAALRQALVAALTAAQTEVRGAFQALDRRLAAVAELERIAVPALDDNESLALKSFEAGEIGLGELLLIRREILETRLSLLDRRLEAAQARFELKSAAGAMP